MQEARFGIGFKNNMWNELAKFIKKWFGTSGVNQMIEALKAVLKEKDER